jgi:selenoprotein W-related protein
LTDLLLANFRNRITRIVLLPSSGGRHEITIDGELIHSKKATGQHPDPATVVEEVRRRLDAA